MNKTENALCDFIWKFPKGHIAFEMLFYATDYMALFKFCQDQKKNHFHFVYTQSCHLFRKSKKKPVSKLRQFWSIIMGIAVNVECVWPFPEVLLCLFGTQVSANSWGSICHTTACMMREVCCHLISHCVGVYPCLNRLETGQKKLVHNA